MSKKLFMGFALALALVGCSQEEELVNMSGEPLKDLTGEIVEAGSRTYLGSGGSVLWSAGDAISLFKKNGYHQKYTVREYNTSSTGFDYANYSNKLSYTNDLHYAVYPFSEGHSINGSTLTLDLSSLATQSYNSNTFENGKAVMVAKSNTTQLAFTNAFSLANVQLTGEQGISPDEKIIVTQIEVTSANKTLAGIATVNMNQDKPAAVFDDNNGFKTITLNCGTGVELTTAPTNFYILMPAVTFPAGDLTVTIYATVAGEEKEYVSNLNNADAPFYRSKVTTLPKTIYFEDWTGTTETIIKIVENVADANAALQNNTGVDIADATGTEAITVPAKTEYEAAKEHTIDLSDATMPTGSPVQITVEEGNASNHTVETLKVVVPEGATANDFTITAPGTTVTLTTANGTVIGTIIAETADETLVISSGITVNMLKVQKGNVRIEAGATVKEIVRYNNTDAVTFVYFEGELPTTGSSDPKIVYMSADFIKVSDNEYQIKSAAGLKSFRDAVNGGEPFAGKTITLAADIDLNNEEWTPIGSATADHGFMGNFDGNGYTIKNLKITSIVPDADGYVYAGLFGVTEGTDANNENYIKNLTIENVKIDLNGHIVAAAIAYPYYTSLENIKVKGNVTIKGGDYTSGVLAYTRRCVNAKNISIEGNEGSSIEGSSTVGGVISDIQMNGGLKANYSNFAASGLTIMGNKCVGGISGIISQQTLNGATVENVTIDCDDNRTGIVSGALGGTSTITNVSHENVTGATLIIGDSYSDGSDVIVNGNVYDLALNWRLKDGIYEIASAKGMFWFANEVNINKNAFNGKTVKLVADIDLANADWTPIGQTGATTFNGVFDGQNFTISNLNVDSEAQTGKHYSSGLFGWVESHTAGHGHIKNVKINGATIVGHHNCGALVGYITQGTALVENCHVTGAAISCTYANGDADGDKAGALIGNATVATPVKNCTAANSTVSGGRDSGQVIGAGKEANVTGCSATNVTVAANGTETGENVRNEVIGRLLN